MLRRLVISALAALTTVSQSRLGATDYLASSSEGFFHFPFRLYQPAGTSTPLPLVVFLPGSGETFPMYSSNPPLSLYNKSSILGGGLDGDSNGVTDLIDVALDGSDPAIVVVPQFLSQYPATGGGYHQWGHEPTKLNELIDYLRTTLPVDSRRIYLTGISAGGTGIWYALQQRPELHAAVVPASSRNASSFIWASPEPDLPAIDPVIVKDIPAWLFHGNNDFTIDADETRLMRNALVAAGAAPRFTEIVGMGHGGWENIYQDNPGYTGAFVAPTTVVPASAPNYFPPTPPAPIAMDSASAGLYPWLFSQQKPAAAAMLPQPQPGRRVLIDFGTANPSAVASSPDSQGWFWNSGAYVSDLDYALSVYGLPAGLHSFGLLDTTGTKCRMALRLLAPFQSNGMSGVFSSGSYPSAAQADWWSNPPSDRASIRIEGLVSGALHRVKVFASRADGSNADRLTRYSIGSVTSDLQVTNNTGSVAVLDEIESDAEGYLDLTVSPSPLRTGGNPNTYLGVVDIEVLAGPVGTYSRWAWDFDLTGTAADPGVDGDSDGMCNLLEHALGLNPHLSDSAGVFPVSYNPATERLSATYPLLRGDVIYSVETATTIGDPGSWTTVGVDQGFTPSTPLGTMVSASVPAVPGETRRFLRLRVTLP